MEWKSFHFFFFLHSSLTCDLAFAHLTPQSFGLALGPVLEFLGEAPEELVLPNGDRHATLHSG